MKEKFYICRRCGNLIGILHKSNVPMMCCGEKMEALVPNTTEAAGEKHLPVETEKGGQRRILKPGENPEATFCIGDDKPVAVYAYCNLHGLWMTEIK